MKRRNLFIIAAITAVITSFGLHAAFGFNHWRHYNNRFGYNGFHHRCDDYGKDSLPAKTADPSSKNSTTP